MTDAWLMRRCSSSFGITHRARKEAQAVGFA